MMAAYYASWSSSPGQHGWTARVTLEHEGGEWLELAAWETESIDPQPAARVILAHALSSDPDDELVSAFVDRPGHDVMRNEVDELRGWLDRYGVQVAVWP